MEIEDLCKAASEGTDALFDGCCWALCHLARGGLSPKGLDWKMRQPPPRLRISAGRTKAVSSSEERRGCIETIVQGPISNNLHGVAPSFHFDSGFLRWTEKTLVLVATIEPF